MTGTATPVRLLTRSWHSPPQRVASVQLRNKYSEFKILDT
jgi:hypothetical protein